MKKVSMPYSVVALIFLIVLNACAGSTKLIATWKDKKYDAGYVNSILIVGLTKDAAARKLYEETFSNRFSRAGVNAVSSLSLIPPEKEMNKDTIKSAAVAESMKAVLVTHLAGSGEKEVYQPGPTGPSRSARYFGNYIPSVYSSSYSMGAYKKQEFVKLISNLYETSTEKLIWTGVSESINPESDKSIIETLVGKVIEDLRKNNLIE
jgi:hypothetical protein